MCLGEGKRIEHRDDIPDVLGQRIGGIIMRFIARAVTSGIYENETVVGFEGVDVPDPRQPSMLQKIPC